jgi:iron complex outermembrane receptor protein
MHYSHTKHLLFFPLVVASLSTVAQDVPAPERIEEVIVTGTFVPRTAFDSMSPIDIVSEEDIQLTASDEIMDTLAQLVPSFNVQRLPMADGLVFVRPARLRNLSPDHTLVLVNGKRRHRSALLGSNGSQSADLAQIPSYAIKRIEVLRDGASAQYGSDAMAGVINIILNDDEGISAFGQYGEYKEGDGAQYRVGLRAGKTLDNGFVTLTFEQQDSDRTSRSLQRNDAIAFQAANPDIQVANPVQNWGQPERNSIRLALNSAYTFGATELYAFGTYGAGEGVSDFNWRNPQSTSAYLPSSAFPDFDLNDIFPAGFTPQFGQDDEDRALVFGVRAPDGALRWDLSFNYGMNEIDYFISDTINASLGPASPTSFRPGVLRQTQMGVNADLGYALDMDLAEPVTFTLGVEVRDEEFEIEAGDAASWAIGPGAADGLPSASNGFPGYSEAQAGSFDQQSYSAYLDIDAQITEAWNLGLAVRYEDFSEFGDTLNGKLSARYALMSGLALRATVSTGFRAPTPGQMFSERTSQGLDTTTLNIFTAGRFSPQGPVADVINQRADVNIEALSPEESENLSLGLVWDADPFTLTVDYYRVDVTDRFGTSSTFNPTAEEQAQFVALGVPGGDGITRVNFFQNDFDTSTQGVDVVAGFSTDLGAGSLRLNAAYNWNQTEVDAGALAIDETNRVRFENLLPEHTANASAVYSVGRFDLLARLRYYGEWTDFSFNAAGDIFQKFDAEQFIDLAATWRINEQVSLRLGGENIFDKYPARAEFQASRGLLYSRNAPYDTDGAFYYLRADINF